MKKPVLGLVLALSALFCVHGAIPIGVSFSGGGARAAIGTLAAYDTLLPHLEGITFGTERTTVSSISGTSGGTWGITLHEEGRVTEKTNKKGAFETLKAWAEKNKEDWGPEADSGDAATVRFNEEWKERVCYAIYAPFAEDARFCVKKFGRNGQQKVIIDQMNSEANRIYFAINAYKVTNHRQTGNNAAQLSGEDSQKPDYFLRFSPRSQTFYVCDEVDCSNPKITEVFLAQTETRIAAQKARNKERQAKGEPLVPYNNDKWVPIVSENNPASLLEVLSFASSAYSSTIIPSAVRATSIQGAIQIQGTSDLIPVILADAGIFQNNPFGLLGERIIVSFDFSDIKDEKKWETGYVTSSLKAKNVKTEAIAMPKPQAPAAAAGAVAAAAAAQVKSQAVDPDVAFLIHRIADPPKTFIQVPARFIDNALAYKDFPTKRLLATAVTYSAKKMDKYYNGLSKFYAAIKDKLQQTIVAEITAIVQQELAAQQARAQAQQQAPQQAAAATPAAAAPPSLF